MWSQGEEPPYSLVHPGSRESVDVRSLRGALFAASTPANLPAWRDLVGDEYDLPSFEAGDLVELDDLALIVDFVERHLTDAAAEAASIAGTAPGLALSGFRPPASAAAELVGFVDAARRWLTDAQRHGGPAIIREQPATIADSTVRQDPETRRS